MTNLLDCFDILPDRRSIRIKGTRIDWEHVVQQYQNGMSVETIANYFAHPLPVELVYAAVTYYLLNKEEYEEYVRRGDEIAKRDSEEYWAKLTPEQQQRQLGLQNRLREMKAKFVDSHGRLDYESLRAYVAQKREPVGLHQNMYIKNGLRFPLRNRV